MDDPGAADPRTRLRQTVPARYRWWQHVALIAAFTAFGVAIPLARLDRMGPADVLALGAMLIAIVLGEWASHRWSMHVPRFPRAVYHRHVVEHHSFFTDTRMAIDAWPDLRWVLFPPWALPLLIASVLPFFVGLYVLSSPRLAWLLLLAVIGYYGVYEIAHVLAHVSPGTGPAGRLVTAVMHHHRVHHDPALMRRWNFNFVVPLADWLFGTTWRPKA